MNDIKKQFYDYINTSLNDTLNTFKKDLIKNPKFKYAVSENDKIDFLKQQKEELIPLNINPYFVMGVNYSNGSYNLNETELKELLEVYQVNLNDTTKGLFNNANDETKPFAWRSHSIVFSTLNYCLQLQIINELINGLKTYNFKTPEGEFIFYKNEKENINSEAFFKYLVDNWLKDEPHIITALKHITYKLWYKNNYNEIPFKITSTLTDFANYWNDNYKHLIELNIDNPKLNEEDKTGGQYYDNKLKYYLAKFKGV
jgi:hypothetical protein